MGSTNTLIALSFIAVLVAISGLYLQGKGLGVFSFLQPEFVVGYFPGEDIVINVDRNINNGIYISQPLEDSNGRTLPVRGTDIRITRILSSGTNNVGDVKIRVDNIEVLGYDTIGVHEVVFPEGKVAADSITFDAKVTGSSEQIRIEIYGEVISEPECSDRQERIIDTKLQSCVGREWVTVLECDPTVPVNVEGTWTCTSPQPPDDTQPPEGEGPPAQDQPQDILEKIRSFFESIGNWILNLFGR